MLTPSTSIVPPAEPSAMPRLEFSVNVPVASSVPPLSVILVVGDKGTTPSWALLPAKPSEEISSVVPALIVVPPEYVLLPVRAT